MRRTVVLFLVIAMVGGVQAAFGQAAGSVVRGHIVDDTGGALPGVTVELRSEGGGMEPQVQVSDGGGDYTFEGVQPGKYQVSFTLLNFASVTRRGVDVGARSDLYQLMREYCKLGFSIVMYSTDLEELLGDDGAADEARELQGDARDERQYRRAEGVHPQHAVG